MAPASADFPEPFSEVLARLRDVLGLLRDHVALTSATGPCLAEGDVPDARLNATDAAAGDAPGSSPASPEGLPPGHDALGAALRSCAQSLEACGRAPLSLLVQGCERALPSLQPAHERHAPEAHRVIEQALLAVLQQSERPVGNELALAAELFPPYQAVQQLAGVDRAHPADLWPGRHPLLGLPSDPFAAPRGLDEEARLALEEALLKTLKQPGPEAFRAMSDLCTALGEGAAGAQADLWKLAGAVYEAQADELLPPDVYLKRMGPRLLSLGRATRGPAEMPALAWAPGRPDEGAQAPLDKQARAQESARQLGHELLFRCHCALAAAGQPQSRPAGPRLERVAAACGVPLHRPQADAAPDTAAEAVRADLTLGEPRVSVETASGVDAGDRPQEAGDIHAGVVGEATFKGEHRVEEQELMPDLLLPLESPDEPSLQPAERTAVQRSLADAVPGLPSAADLDLAGWGLAANADRVVTPDDEIKVIGALRLEIPVFNVFLNDADEASRRLSMVLAEWADAPELPVPAEAAVQAFALAQGADRVGHAALAALAYQLVRVLRACAAGPTPAAVAADPAWAALNLTEAVEEMRRVLHQFAAGFLTEPSAACVQRLAECLSDRLPHSASGHRADGSGARSVSDDGELQSLHDLASLQTELASALDRLAQVRPSQAASASDLAVADQHFDRAWSEATDRLAAAEGLIRSLLDRPRDPER
ncbi:MAG: hypothetical protein WCI59_09105 [Betaproteobacteria bacterium]